MATPAPAAKPKAPKPSGPGTTGKKPGPGLGSAGSTADVDTSQPRPATEDGTTIDPLLDREVDLKDWDPRLPPHGTPIGRPDPGRPYPEDGERGVPWDNLPPSVAGSVEAFPEGATTADPTGAKAKAAKENGGGKSSGSGKSDADVASKEAGVGRKPTDTTR